MSDIAIVDTVQSITLRCWAAWKVFHLTNPGSVSYHLSVIDIDWINWFEICIQGTLMKVKTYNKSYIDWVLWQNMLVGPFILTHALEVLILSS